MWGGEARCGSLELPGGSKPPPFTPGKGESGICYLFPMESDAQHDSNSNDNNTWHLLSPYYALLPGSVLKVLMD